MATIEWDEGGKRLRLESNRVDLLVEAASRPTSLAAYRFAATGTMSTTIAAPRCGNAPATLAAAWRAIPLAPARLAPAERIRAGEPLLLVLDHADGNRDPGAVESVAAEVVARSGDRETLTVFETGPDTGRFAGYVQTVPAGEPAASGDCRLAVERGDRITVRSVQAAASVEVAADPLGLAFDSVSAGPVGGARISLVDAATGQPATVYGDDGSAAFPATIVAGASVRDAAGKAYDFTAGGYRFPFVPAGTYRLKVEAPAPYASPSARTPADLAGLTRPDGQAFTLAPASYGEILTLADAAPVEVDIPLDPAGKGLNVAIRAGSTEAGPGETVAYAIDVANADPKLPSGRLTLADRFGAAMRLRPGTLRVDGAATAPTPGADGFTLDLPPLPPGGKVHVVYALEVRADARPGDAVSQAELHDDRGGRSNLADVAVRIRRDLISSRLTLEGRVVDGACGTAGRGLAGVRIMIEDGSYALTDPDGRYHFEGVAPGTHVVQLDDATLPADRALVDCAHDTRSGGRAFSRFVEGEGGALKRVDFHAIPSPARAAAAAAAAPRPTIPTDAAAAGAERDWLAGQTPGIAFLFPEPDYNPRAPLVRVAVKHGPEQSVRLYANDKPVPAVAFDGTRKNETVAVSLWRSIPLTDGATELRAEVLGPSGAVADTLTRIVHYGASPMRAELVRDRSRLVADGVTRPLIAVRFTDRDGRPVRHGLVGDFELPAPYYPAVEADAQQARQLAGLERARPFWHVEGDDGIAYIELEPTTASGSLGLRFNFSEGRAVREQRLELWLDPGNRPWTLVGLAEGTAGYNRLSGRMEGLAGEADTTLTDGRLALYAKGRILGRWLMTLAYDSDKKEDDTRFAGTIDPRAYYTIYADRSERRYDAASTRKLYLKLERPQFYALFGDYETGIDEPQLARYVRAFNGAKAEYRSERVSATAFAADAPTTHRRVDLQGSGLTGPYVLGSRDILANSERITIETRDRLRSDRIVDSRLLIRHADYEIDYRTGLVRFNAPVLSRSSDLDPVFIVAEFEVDGVARRALNAGGRVAWRSANGKLQAAATAIHDADEARSTDLAGVDLRYRPDASTEIRAEAAVSDGRARAGASAGSGAGSAGTAAAWLVEAEHHGSRYDLLAYARQQDEGFGLGQTSAAEAGTRKLGFDGRVKFSDRLSLTGSAWFEDYLATDARRVAARALLEYRADTLSARAGLTFADDRLTDGRTARSTILQLGATKRLLANKLELDAQTEIPLDRAESVDFPARHRFGARYAVSNAVQLVAGYEIADGAEIDARTARIGFDIHPWAGAHVTLSGNRQDIAEYGPRSFAAFGLAQSLTLGKNWAIDLTLDSNKTLSGIDPARVLNPLHPVASGGYVGGGALTEDFTAATAGATYRAGLWTVTGRAEYRDGGQDDRYGLTAGFIRQLGDGSAVGGAFNWFTARAQGGAETRTMNLQLSWAHRPAASAWTWLEKLELREDAADGAVAGAAGPLGTFMASGDLRSRRLVNALALNWSPDDRREVSIFWGSRYASDKVDGADLAGWSNVVGADLRFDLSDMIDIGLGGSLREGAGGRSFAWSAGPSLGLKPFDNGWISIGWNVVGFDDRDFAEARYTRAGPYVTMRLKFDQTSLAGLGLGARR
ncbi:MAG: hypothetical protein ACJ8EB_13380 [Allosphingosinicella sp.]